MTIKYFDTEEELDTEFERTAELNFELIQKKEAVEDAQKELADAEQDLNDFIEDNKEVLIL